MTDPAKIKISCPHCHKTINATKNHIGKTVACPGCKEKFVATIDDDPFALVPEPAIPSPRAFAYTPNPVKPTETHSHQTVIVQQTGNVPGIALAGLILNGIGWLTCGLLCLVGVPLSFFGLFQKGPKGIAIAGLIVGFPGVLFFLLMGFGLITAFLGIGAAATAVNEAAKQKTLGELSSVPKRNVDQPTSKETNEPTTQEPLISNPQQPIDDRPKAPVEVKKDDPPAAVIEKTSRPTPVPQKQVPIPFGEKFSKDTIAIWLKGGVIGKVPLIDIGGDSGLSANPCLSLLFRVDNYSERKIVEINENQFMTFFQLTDDVGNRFRGINFGINKLASAKEQNGRIQPKSTALYEECFEVPPDNTQSLIVKVDLKVFGSEGEVEFEIPFDKVSRN